jgi:hypothetical protein
MDKVFSGYVDGYVIMFTVCLGFHEFGFEIDGLFLSLIFSGYRFYIV